MTTSDEDLTLACLSVLKRIQVISEVGLSILVHAERKDVLRVMREHPNVRVTKAPAVPLVFEWRDA